MCIKADFIQGIILFMLKIDFGLQNNNVFFAKTHHATGAVIANLRFSRGLVMRHLIGRYENIANLNI